MQCFMLSVIRRHSRVHAVSVGKCTRGTLPSALMRMTTSQTLTRTPETHTRGRLPSATSQTVTRTPETHTRGRLPSATFQIVTKTPETHTRGRLPSATSRVATFDLRKTGTGGGASSGGGAGATVGVCVWEHRLPIILLYIPIIPIIYIGYSIIVIFCSNITTSFYKIIHFTTLHYYEVCI